MKKLQFLSNKIIPNTVWLMFPFAFLCHAAFGQDVPHYYERAMALSIGIADYRDAEIKDLDKAASDAELVATTFKNAYGYEPRLLQNHEATKERITVEIKECGRRVGVNGVLIIYFSGHGIYVDDLAAEEDTSQQTGFLVPYDADIALQSKNIRHWRTEAIEMCDLVDSLRQLKCRHVVLIADCCYSGFLTKSRKGGIEHGGLATLLNEGSRSVFAATKKSEYATDGLFAKILERRLLHYSNNREAFTLTDLFVKIRPDVVKKSRNGMTPMLSMFGEGDGELVFFPKSIPAEEVRELRRVVEHFEKNLPDQRIVKGLRERTQNRWETRMQVAEVIEAFSANDYRYTIDPEEKEAYWKGKLRRFQEHAGLADPLAMAGLHYCYAKGLGTDQDPELAYYWAKLASETNSPAGLHVLGRCYSHSLGVAENLEAANKYIEMAAQKEFPISFLATGLLFLERGQVSEAIDELNRASNEGIRLADYYLGKFHLDLLKSYAATKHFKDLQRKDEGRARIVRAAKADVGVAQLLLAAIERDSENINACEHWLRRAARSGNGRAQGMLAQALSGLPVLNEIPLDLKLKTNRHEALRWAKLSSNGGHAEGHIALALLNKSYPNVREAAVYCDRAIELNSARAMLLKSQWLYAGEVWERDIAEAVRLARNSAELHDIEGQRWAAALFLDNFSPGNQYLGLHYFTLAASKGDKAAVSAVKELYRNGKRSEFRDRDGAKFWDPFRKEYPSEFNEFLKIALSESPANLMYYVNGKDSTNRQAWYYVLIDPSIGADFKNLQGSTNLNLKNYGTIVASGYGLAPPPQTVARMKAVYGFVSE